MFGKPSPSRTIELVYEENVNSEIKARDLKIITKFVRLP